MLWALQVGESVNKQDEAFAEFVLRALNNTNMTRQGENA